jgi:hypothetical protein
MQEGVSQQDHRGCKHEGEEATGSDQDTTVVLSPQSPRGHLRVQT